MPCKSRTLQKVAKQTDEAKQAINRLEESLNERNNHWEKELTEKIDEFIHSTGYNDFDYLHKASETKIEYTSEFSLDKILKVVVEAVNIVSEVITKKGLNILISEDATDVYSDFVLSVSEASKSKSASSSRVSKSQSKIAPGLMAFLICRSYDISNKNLFGNKSVTATSVNFAVIGSPTMLKKDSRLTTTAICLAMNIKMIEQFKLAQSALIQDLVDNNINEEEYEIKFKFYQEKIIELTQLNEKSSNKNKVLNLEVQSLHFMPAIDKNKVAKYNSEEIINRLQLKVETYKTIIQQTKSVMK